LPQEGAGAFRFGNVVFVFCNEGLNLSAAVCAIAPVSLIREPRLSPKRLVLALTKKAAEAFASTALLNVFGNIWRYV